MKRMKVKDEINTWTLVTVPNLLKCSFNFDIVFDSTGILRISSVVDPSVFCPKIIKNRNISK